MIWGGISTRFRTQALIIVGNLNAQRYRDDVLTPEVLPFLVAHPNMTFMQDNATPHTAIATRQHLQNANVNVLDWPAKSPDLNPIEHLWDNLDKKLRQRRQQPGNVQQLRQALVAEWNAIHQPDIGTLVNSMRRRCQAVIDAQGGHTRY
jgi:transposase